MMEAMGTMEKQEILSVDESLQIMTADALESYKKSYLKAMEQGVLMETQIEKLVANSRLMQERIKELEEENKDYENLVKTMQEEIDSFKPSYPDASETVENVDDMAEEQSEEKI